MAGSCAAGRTRSLHAICPAHLQLWGRYLSARSWIDTFWDADIVLDVPILLTAESTFAFAKVLQLKDRRCPGERREGERRDHRDFEVIETYNVIDIMSQSFPKAPL